MNKHIPKACPILHHESPINRPIQDLSAVEGGAVMHSVVVEARESKKPRLDAWCSSIVLVFL